MPRLRLNWIFGLAFALALALASNSAAADRLGQSVVVDGVLVYLGVVPSSSLRSDVKHYSGHNAQCPVPGGRDNHHIMIALFDRATGERITDADVYGRVSPLGLVGPRKHFGAVTVAGVVTYCNYFDLPPRDVYKIDMEIRRDGGAGAIEASFSYKPYQG